LEGKDSYKRRPAAGSKHIYIKVVPNTWHKFVREGDGYNMDDKSIAEAQHFSILHKVLITTVKTIPKISKKLMDKFIK
jgi:hypothetical protein